MKYKTFVRLRMAIILVLVVGVLAGIISLVSNGLQRSVANDSASTVAPTMDPTEAPTAAATPTQWLPTVAVAPFDEEILRTATTASLDEGIDDGESVKWRKKSAQSTVEYRCDKAKGFTMWNRVKIDRDNDKKFDEKWSITSPTEVKRMVSTADDGSYDATYDLTGATWTRR